MPSNAKQQTRVSASQFKNTNKSKLIANLFVNDVENDFLRHKETNVTQFMGIYFEIFQ